MDFAERAARNEEVFRGVNERIEAGAIQHQVSDSLPFHCECGASACVETIEIPRARYADIARERYHFVVIHEPKSYESRRLSRPKLASSWSRRSARRERR